MDAALLNAMQKKWGAVDYSRWQTLRQPKYDTIRYPSAGTTQLTFFTVPIGGTDPQITGAAKTTEQTNLTQSGTFGQEFFAITQIRTWAGLAPLARQPAAAASFTDSIYAGFCGATAADGGAMRYLYNLFNRGTLRLGIAEKNFFQIDSPFINAPPGFGVDIQSMATNKLATSPFFSYMWTQQDTKPQNVYGVDPILIIDAQQQFTVTIDFTDGTSPVFTNKAQGNTAGSSPFTPNVDVMVVLEGYVIRPQA